jgi:hypothetical protein
MPIRLSMFIECPWPVFPSSVTSCNKTVFENFLLRNVVSKMSTAKTKNCILVQVVFQPLPVCIPSRIETTSLAQRIFYQLRLRWRLENGRGLKQIRFRRNVVRRIVVSNEVPGQPLNQGLRFGLTRLWIRTRLWQRMWLSSWLYRLFWNKLTWV